MAPGTRYGAYQAAGWAAAKAAWHFWQVLSELLDLITWVTFATISSMKFWDSAGDSHFFAGGQNTGSVLTVGIVSGFVNSYG